MFEESKQFLTNFMSSKLEKNQPDENIDSISEETEWLKRRAEDKVHNILFTSWDDRRPWYGHDGQFRPSVLFTADQVRELNWWAYYGPEFAIKK